MAVRGRIAAVPVGAAASLRGSFPIDVVIRDTSPPRADRSADRAAVDAILGGQADGFRVLVDREAATVIRACYRILGDPNEAEDAAQEAFVIAYRSLASWRGDGAFGAWLSRIAVRVALRQASRRRAVAWVDPITQPDGVTDDQAADPATLAVRAEHSADLRAAVARLDEPYRETIALRFFAERSLAEIAAETGRPLGTVKTHLHRGLLRLRDALAEREAER
jgi:RNA polymerase sigma-70 factor (ECF subfamily)